MGGRFGSEYATSALLAYYQNEEGADLGEELFGQLDDKRA
jgi:hypothetical protein